MRCGAGARHLDDELLEPLEREGEVRAALGGGERVDLVDDHRARRWRSVVARRRRQHQVEGLGRRDQQVGRAAQQRLAIVAPSVAGAHRHRRHVERLAEPLGREADAASGARRFFSTSNASARSGEM